MHHKIPVPSPSTYAVFETHSDGIWSCTRQHWKCGRRVRTRCCIDEWPTGAFWARDPSPGPLPILAPSVKDPSSSVIALTHTTEATGRDQVHTLRRAIRPLRHCPPRMCAASPRLAPATSQAHGRKEWCETQPLRCVGVSPVAVSAEQCPKCALCEGHPHTLLLPGGAAGLHNSAQTVEGVRKSGRAALVAASVTVCGIGPPIPLQQRRCGLARLPSLSRIFHFANALFA